MTRWLERTFAVSSGMLTALLAVVVLGSSAVALRYVAEYVVNSHRDSSHWVEYNEVKPVADSFPVGTQPIFYTRAIWHQEIVVAWKDILWCEPSEGPYKGKRIRHDATGSERREVRRPGMSGYYDEAGYMLDGSSSGYWQWDGPIPAHAGTCWLEPRPTLYPSEFVTRHVSVDLTPTFEFR